jgi:hypothetical protein
MIAANLRLVQATPAGGTEVSDLAPSFEHFYASTVQRLFTALCLVTGDRHEAEEIAQESFVRVFERWDRVREFGRTEDELRACANESFDNDVTAFEARVNGQDVADLDAYRTTSPMFTITIPESNPLGLEPGVSEMVSETVSFIIAPPPPGTYEVAVSTTLAGNPEPGGVTNTIIVAAPDTSDAAD